MCYSALVKQHLKGLGLEFNARVQLYVFEDLYESRAQGAKLKLPRAMDFNFTQSTEKSAAAIQKHISAYIEQTRRTLEADLFAQKKRLADAERKLKEKFTKTAEKEKGVAERKIAANLRRRRFCNQRVD